MSLLIATNQTSIRVDQRGVDRRQATEKTKILFVINRNAGTIYGTGVEQMIFVASSKHNSDCEIAFTEYIGHAVLLATDAVNNGFDYVVAVGGDGTANEVAQGLMHSTVAMGIIATGSGNGLARHLGISLNMRVAVDQLFTSHILPIDTFKINGRLSLNVSGLGFDGHITNLFGVKSKRGLMGYVRLAISEFLKFDEFDIQIELNGVCLKRKAFIVAIANSSQYGNNAQIAPMASVTDGLLHLNIVKKIPWYRMDFLVQFFTGQIQRSPYCRIIEFQHAILTTNTPVAFHVDGEPGGFSDTFEIEVQHRSLNVLVPKLSKA